MPAATRRLPRQTIRSRIALSLEVPGKGGKSSIILFGRRLFFSLVPDKLRNRKLVRKQAGTNCSFLSNM